ncbi:MAG: ABC transporter ATP-binding protein/permease [Spirochaetia bacterium]|nr:ABC transporter ATP-binding protein/permease [Spirochaetia bacterium]
MKPFLETMRFLSPYRKPMVISFILLICSSLLMLLQPKMTQWAIDIGIAAGSPVMILGFAAAIGLSAVLSMTVSYYSGVKLIHASQHMSYDMRNELFKKISAFSFADFDAWRTGELIVRINSDVSTIRMFIRMGLFLLIQSLIILIGSLTSMFIINARIASVMAVIMPIVLALFFFSASSIRPIFEQVRTALDQVNNTLQENLVGAKLVRSFSRQPEEIRKFDTGNLAYFHISRKVSMLIGIIMPLMMLFGNLAVVIVLYAGGNMVADPANGMTLGSLIAFSNYTLTAFFPLIMLGMVLSFLSMALASMKRVHELLQITPTIREPQDPVHLSSCAGRITFSDVSFRYGDGAPVFEHFDLSIDSGEMVGIIGTTGAGKSTLMHLLPRFYDTQEGSITLDDIDICRISLSSLRSRITIALQETMLFSGTIAENIRFGKPDATDREIREAAAAACAHEFIMEKEGGYEHVLGERGQGLSGGQRQRISIARAILSAPDILILDDVTSALDASTERTIIEHLHASEVSQTRIIISQKINAIRQTDRILVMDRGTIIASGTHDELIQSCRTYQEIYETQNPAS